MSGPRRRRIDRRVAILQILAAARELGWDDGFLADVLHDQLAAYRLQCGIVGPCHYCGTWLASTVDHVVPVSRGGTNARENLVSSCLVCNSGKADRTPEQWLAALTQRRIMTATPEILDEIRREKVPA
jgi:hypothetical protein